jgi:nitroimidazol reductase NimA-like FMN-containing flavoprotein (pyridoxamine 5'-phosphate oxidase superfamily)
MNDEEFGIVHQRVVHFDALSQANCARILHDQTLGRVGFLDDQGIPQIYPVTYRFRDGRIYFLASGSSRLWQVTSGRRVAFEVDGWNSANGTGWSVLVNGICTLAEAGEVRAAVDAGLRPWLLDDRPKHWVRIVPQVITGRRLDEDQALKPDWD